VKEPYKNQCQISANGGVFQARSGGFSWALLCANLLMFILIESRKAASSRIRDVGVAGSNPVIPTKKIKHLGAIALSGKSASEGWCLAGASSEINDPRPSRRPQNGACGLHRPGPQSLSLMLRISLTVHKRAHRISNWSG
jgi:hypothetical protein